MPDIIVPPTAKSGDGKDKKICPLLSTPIVAGARPTPIGQGMEVAVTLAEIPCVKEKCAFWDDKEKTCIIYNMQKVGRKCLKCS